MGFTDPALLPAFDPSTDVGKMMAIANQKPQKLKLDTSTDVGKMMSIGAENSQPENDMLAKIVSGFAKPMQASPAQAAAQAIEATYTQQYAKPASGNPNPGRGRG